MTKLAAAILMISCIGCVEVDMPLKVESRGKEAAAEDSHRVSVTRVGVFKDDLAYGGKRGVYVVKDNDTGKEYIGISGIGISENGSHQTGKDCTPDER